MFFFQQYNQLIPNISVCHILYDCMADLEEGIFTKMQHFKPYIFLLYFLLFLLQGIPQPFIRGNILVLRARISNI